MHPLALLILVANCAGTVHTLPAAAGTPAEHSWVEALPGTPMPEAIADLIHKGIDHSPLVERYNGADAPHIVTIIYHCVSDCPDKSTVPPGLFFHKEQVRAGSTMTVALPPVALPGILPRDVAEKIPFSNGNLADVLSTFHVAPNSTEAARVAFTLSRCHAPGPSDEQKACTTSLESTVKSAIHMLGTTSPRGVSAVASELSSAGLPLQQYQVQAVSPIRSDGYVGCHIMPYPYAVYYCHTTTGMPSEAYVISLRGLSEGSPPAIAMAAICHMDTSKWSPAYPAFEILNTYPGAPVCHFLLYANLLFVHRS